MDTKIPGPRGPQALDSRACHRVLELSSGRACNLELITVPIVSEIHAGSPLIRRHRKDQLLSIWGANSVLQRKGNGRHVTFRDAMIACRSWLHKASAMAEVWPS